jgi:hypothetical protein
MHVLLRCGDYALCECGLWVLRNGDCHDHRRHVRAALKLPTAPTNLDLLIDGEFQVRLAKFLARAKVTP